MEEEGSLQIEDRIAGQVEMNSVMEAGENKADTMSEYIDIISQFGIVAIFNLAFPLVSVFSIISVYLKLKAIQREVAYKRRIEPEISFGIGQFHLILTGLAHLAIVSSVALAYFRSERY